MEACCLWKAVETGQNRHGAHVFAFLPFDLLLLERLWVLVLWCALLQLRSACVEVGRRERTRKGEAKRKWRHDGFDPSPLPS